MGIVILIMILIGAGCSLAIANGIDYMQKNHPDYKGEDLFGEDKKIK